MRFFLFLILFFWGWGHGNAELIDYIEGSTRVSNGFTKINSGEGTGLFFTFTGSFSFTGYQYAKSIDCYVKNYDTSIGYSDFDIILSPNSNFSANYLRIIERIGSGQIKYFSYPINQVLSGSIYYFQLRNSFQSQNTNNMAQTLCYINITKFTQYLNFNSNSSMYGTGDIIVNNNISNQSIDIFSSEESMLEFFIFEFVFIMIIMIFAFLYRLIKF